MRISVGQFGPVGDVEANLAVMARLAARAAGEGADLLVLPEEAMLGAREVGEEFPDAVAAAWEPFAAGLAALAREHGIAVVAGGYEPGPDRRPYNTLLAVGADGARLGAYRKLHLYDAFAHRESDRISPGDGGVAGVRPNRCNNFVATFPSGCPLYVSCFISSHCSRAPSQHDLRRCDAIRA